MAKFVFGKALEFLFHPTIDGEPVKVHSLSGAYIFEDVPSSAQIDTPSGYLGSVVTTWNDEGEFAKKISFAALTDSDEHSVTEYETRYVLVKFLYEAAGAVKWVVEQIFVFRPSALTSRITVNYVDVLNLEPALKNHRTPAEIEKFIATAKKDLFRRYKAAGIERKHMFNLEEMNDACLYRATALADISLFKDTAQHWQSLYELRNGQYEMVFAETRVGYDRDGQGTPTPDEYAGSGHTATWFR